MSEILLEIESSLADQENSQNSISLMLENLKEDIEENINKSTEKISKDEIIALLKDKTDFDVSLVCPKCNTFLFSNDVEAQNGNLNCNAKDCCVKYYSKSHEISRTNLDYWYHFLNEPFKTIKELPNYTRFLFYSIEGIPSQLRSRIWGMLLNCCDNFGEINNDWCENLFQNLNDDNSPFLRVIVNDLNRIFPGLHYFQDKAKGQENLKKILNAYSLYDAEIGYCQGLPFLIGLILFHFRSNEMTFLSAINIFEKKKNLNFKRIFDEKMSGLELWFYQFKEIFKKHDSELYDHFDSLNIDLKLFTSKWFLSFFAVGCPMQILIKLFDVMIIEGFQSSIFKISLIILSKNKGILMELNEPEEIHQHLLSKNIWDCYDNDLNLIINDILALNSDLISQEFLNELEEKFNKTDTPSIESHSSFLSVSPKKRFGHKYSKSTSLATLSVDIAKSNGKLTNMANHSSDNILQTPSKLNMSKSVANTPMDSEFGLFKFFKYGFSQSNTPTTPNSGEKVDTTATATAVTAPVSGNGLESPISPSDKKSLSESDRSSTQSSDSNNLFDEEFTNDCESSNSSAASAIEKKDDSDVRDIIINLPEGLDNTQHKRDLSTANSEQINYFANIPPPNAKSVGASSSPSNLGIMFGGHSRSMSDVQEFKSNQHLKNQYSITSNFTEMTAFSCNSSLSPQSNIDSTFSSPMTKHIAVHNHHQRTHSYTPSISSISSCGKAKSRQELKEMEMASEIEILKSKLEIYEKIMDDDKKLIKNLFKLYLYKDDVVENGKQLTPQQEEKLKKREYKVLSEVEGRLKI